MVKPGDGSATCGRKIIIKRPPKKPGQYSPKPSPSQKLFESKRIDPLITPIVWVLGGPGSDKGTQCEKIVSKYGFCHLSTGELLRAEIHSGSERAKTLHDIMIRGELVPNDLVLHLLKEAVLKQMNGECKGFLIDGYPREKSQGLAFERAIAPVTVIFYFEVSTETMTKRMLHRAKTSCRADDNEKTIELRLKTFLDHNSSVLTQYPDKLKVIDAERSIDDIFVDVVAILDPVVQRTNEIVAMGE